MVKNNQYINKPILVTNEVDNTIDTESVSNILNTTNMLTNYNEITKYINEQECMKNYSILTCSHSLDKDMKSFNMAKLSSRDCDILHVKSPLAKMVLIKDRNIVHKEQLMFQKVKLGMLRIPKPTVKGSLSKGKCVKRKKNIVKT